MLTSPHDCSLPSASSLGKFDQIIILRTFEDATTNYTISFENGRYVFGIDNNHLSIHVRNREGITLNLNSTNDFIEKTIYQRRDGASIVDFTGDGFPGRFVTSDGKFVSLTNDYSRWKIRKEVSPSDDTK